MMWKRLAEVIVRRPVAVLVSAAVVIAVLAAGLTGLQFRTDQDTLVDSGSEVFLDNVQYQDRFGGETMLVLFSGDPVSLFSADNAAALEALEAELRDTAGVATVIGPHAALQYGLDQLSVVPGLLGAAAARAEDPEAYGAALAPEIQRLGAAGEQSLANPEFVRFLIFDSQGEVRGSQMTSFPDENHALLVAQLTGNASIEEQGLAAEAIKEIVGRYEFEGHEVLVTGTPVLLDEINGYLQGGMASLGAIALVVMLVILWLAFRVRWRLLPLLVMAGGTAAALGGAVLIGIDLSLVTISGLPIFIGLGVDFSIQVHNRYAEQRAEGDTSEDAARIALTRMAGPLVTAMVAGAFGFLALLISPVPMIQDFGLLLCLGVVLLVAAAIVLPLAILVLADRNRGPLPIVADAPAGLVERSVGRLTGLSRGVVAGIMAVGLLVAVSGFVVEGRMPIDTEVEHWVSPDGEAVQELEDLRGATGFSSQLGIMVEADDVTADEVVAWMHRFQATELERYPDALVLAASMPGIAGDVISLTPTGTDVQALLEIAPDDIREALVTEDRTAANLQFSIGDLSLSARADLLDSIHADLEGDLAPPAGVTVTPSGLAVIGIELVNGMEANRQTLTLVSLGLVALWLLVHGRFRPRSLLAVVPVGIAVGVASFVIYMLGFELTPLTTVAGPLVIAVATEFTVLLEARYREERARGRTPDEACAALPRIGRAFVASGLTLAGGFAVMAASPMTLLRDFGIVVAIDVVIALISALVIMPPLLRWTDRGTTAAAVPPADRTPDRTPEAPPVEVPSARPRGRLVAQR